MATQFILIFQTKIAQAFVNRLNTVSPGAARSARKTTDLAITVGVLLNVHKNAHNHPIQSQQRAHPAFNYSVYEFRGGFVVVRDRTPAPPPPPQPSANILESLTDVSGLFDQAL